MNQGLHSQPCEMLKSVPRRLGGQKDSCWGVTVSKSHQGWETKVSEDALGLHAVPKAPLCCFSCVATSRHQRLLLGSLCLYIFSGINSAQKQQRKEEEHSKSRTSPGGWGGCLWLINSWRSVTDHWRAPDPCPWAPKQAILPLTLGWLTKSGI